MTGEQLVITGGRTYDKGDQNGRVLRLALAYLKPSLIIQGGCPTGYDHAARVYADGHGIPYVTVHALWRSQGPAAGPKRNALMFQLFKPDRCLAFPGGSGTASCVREAQKAGVPVSYIRPDYRGWPIMDGKCLVESATLQSGEKVSE